MLTSTVSADDVVSRAKEVLLVVVSMTAEELVSEAAWAGLLPTWFLDACAPEQSSEEAAAWLACWRALDPDARERAARERPWSVADWLHWLQPEERQWYWWDALVKEEGSASVWVEVLGWPAPLGAFEWLLRAAGAITVDMKQTLS